MSIYEQIYAKVAEIPAGEVASYGQVAKAAGFFRGAQMVGWALRNLPKDTHIPWQRVINYKRVISIVNPKFPKTLQRTLLEEEGLPIIEEDGYWKVGGDAWHQFTTE